MKMNENTRVTLTLKQLKRFVKETSQDWFGPDFFMEGEMLIEYRGPGGDVVIPEGILSIAMPAFEGKRDKITSLSLPATVVQIVPSSLSFLRNIKSYSVADGNPKFSSKNGMLLSKDGETLLQGIGGDAVIPDGVKEIADEAFAFLNLKSVVIPEGVISIGEVAFCGCENLTEVVIPASVETLKEDAFRDCVGLGKVDILNPKLLDEVMQDPSKCFHGTPQMKNINENSKVTLTLGQLRKLVREFGLDETNKPKSTEQPEAPTGPSLKDIERKMDKALKSIGATRVDNPPREEEAELVFTKTADSDFLQYNLWIYKNPARKLKGYAVRDNGSRIALALYFGVGKDDKVKFHGHLGYSNGISTTNVFSNAPRGMRYNFKYGEPENFKSLFDMVSGGGGTEFYECTPEMLEDIVAGVEDLRYFKEDIGEALKKARFTEIAWRKICSLIQDSFRVPNAY